jgi:hypothetical protein
MLVVALAVFALGTLAPVVEALAPCQETCVDDSRDDACASDQCCSCCVHSRIVSPQRLLQVEALAQSSRLTSPAPAAAATADPREILHIPKALSA